MFLKILIFINFIFGITEIYCLLSNVTHSNLPEIQYGDQCIPGKMYKMECNTCRCTKNNHLMCTKMGCYVLNTTKSVLRSRKSQFPALTGKSCTPGKVYTKGCSTCFCNKKKKALCTGVCKRVVGDKPTKHKPLVVMTDVRPPLKDNEYMGLQSLPHSAAECEPGSTYKIDCNECVCLYNKNLLCTQRLCLSVEDGYKVEAAKLSGHKSCKDDEPFLKPCITCKCINGILQCEAIPDCESNMGPNKLSLAGPPVINKLTLSQSEVECTPNTVYRDKCNKCYCQADRTFRCTQKTCLNYQQTLKLEEQRQFLEEHGL